MAYNITVPFYAFKIQFQADNQFLMPVSDMEAIRIGQSFEILSGKYAETIQHQILNKGRTRQLLGDFHQNKFAKDTLTIHFSQAKDGFSYPDFTLEFEYFFTANPNGVHGILPTMGLEAFAESVDEIADRLREAIRIEFTRSKRLNALQQVVSTIWFDAVELLEDQMTLRVLSPSEVEAAEEHEDKDLLSQAAQLLKIRRKIAYGVQENLHQFAKALKNQFNRNVVLVGPSGVGKTALVWEAVRQQEALGFPGHIWETTASTLIKELTAETGAWENNMALFCKELSGSDNILFIRNLMELFEVGQYSGSDVSLADFLRNYISRGEMIIISECTEEELARIELKSSNFLSFFQIIRIQEPRKNLEEIILKKVNDIATNRQITIDESAISEVIRLHRRFVPYAGMPGRPIRFLESILLNKKAGNPQQNKITRSEVIEHFCEETGMPVFMVDPAVNMNLKVVKNEFHDNIYGQDKAVDSIVNVLASVKTALTRIGKPIASFLFVGPTGVGKTELAKVLANFMFSSRQRMIRFDMSEYSDPVNVMRLIGSDYFSDGLLTAAVRREPFCVLLFDEIEKAHPSFYDLLLQILGEGRLTDHQGKLVNFCSTIIIMTSNIGAMSLQKNRIGWRSKVEVKEVTDHFMNAVQQHFRPELFNRIDEVIPFEPLDEFTIRFVVEREINLFKQREGIRYRRMDFAIEENALNYLGVKGYHDRYGARYLQRIVREELITPLAKLLNAYDAEDQLSVNVRMENNVLTIDIEDDPLGLDLLLEELEKMNQANHSGSLRRMIYLLQDGNAFNQLLNELEDMERAKKHKDFWKDTARVHRYTDFLQIKEQITQLTKKIEALEIDLSLGSLGFESFSPQRYREVEQWEEDFKSAKLRLYSALVPEGSICFFAIYGAQLEPIVNFYLDIFKQKKWTIAAQSVWFRESYYHQEVEVKEVDENGNPFVTSDIRAQYIKQSCHLDEAWQEQIPQPDDKLYGIEFSIFGEGSYLFLQDEGNIHRWKFSEQFNQLYAIFVDKQSFGTPKNIHRLDFYTTGILRREYEPPVIRDFVYKINREIGKRALADFMLEMLEERFATNLNAVIF